MKKCGECGQSYDNSMNYCLDDGTPLDSISQATTLKFPTGEPITTKVKPKPSATNVVEFSGGTNSGIVANNLTIKSPKRPEIEPPVGSIARDVHKLGYIRYLIDRYNDFKKEDKTISEMDYRVIYGAIKREFRCTWKLVPVEHFEALVEYLQGRIDRTILGKNLKKRGNRLYSSFEEFKNGRSA